MQHVITTAAIFSKILTISETVAHIASFGDSGADKTVGQHFVLMTSTSETVLPSGEKIQNKKKKQHLGN